MKISATYKIISSVLAFTMVMTMAVPVLCNTELMEMCTTMPAHHQEEQESSSNHHMMDMDMDHSMMNNEVHHANNVDHTMNESSCEMSIDCMCTESVTDTIPEAVTISIIKVPQLLSAATGFETGITPDPIPPPPVWTSNSYQPPLLFLSNESFLI